MRQDVGPDWMFEYVRALVAFQSLGAPFNDLSGEQKVLLAQDALGLWREEFRIEFGPGDEDCIPFAVTELLRRIGGPGNLASYASTLQAGVGRRTRGMP